MPRKPMPDVIVLLPGILGSVLQRNGKDVWAFSAGALARGIFSGLGTIQDLALTDDPDVDDLGDGVCASRLLSDAHLIPGLWKIDGYTGIAQYIQSTFKVEPGKNYFEFPYDWRRDNAVSARRLKEMALQWLESWRGTGRVSAKLIFVCHSMGGLVARYFLEVLDGWKETRALVTFGTPYRGSLNALNFITNGLEKKVGPVTLLDLSEMLRSFTSVYQLLPIFECYDPGDGKQRRVGEITGIPNMDPRKAAAALSFHNKIREHVEINQKDPEYKNSGYRIYPIVGTHQPTLQSARLEGDSVVITADFNGKDYSGDGTVPRVSATPIELSQERREIFVSQQHGSLQNTQSVLVQLEGILEGNQIDLDIFKAAEPADEPIHLGIKLDDVYEKDEPIRAQIVADREHGALECKLIGDTNGVISTVPVKTGGPVTEVELPPQAAGFYRFSVSGQGAFPVTDMFVVQ
jgi:hypothetical protein